MISDLGRYALGISKGVSGPVALALTAYFPDKTSIKYRIQNGVSSPYALAFGP